MDSGGSEGARACARARGGASGHREIVRRSGDERSQIGSGSTLCAHSSRRQGGRGVIRSSAADARLRGALLRAVGGAMAIVVMAIGVTTAIAADPAEPSDVVVALDFSSSILSDKPNRTKFANALDDIADRVEVTSDDLVNGNAVISLVPFASRAAGFPGCENLALHADPAAVQKLADCLRLAARQYRRGPDASIVSKVGSDTNYVKAMEQAATYLPADSTRPAVVFFTDGKHDVPGTPASAVLPEAQRLFGDRTPFAFLPVGMGLDPNRRGELQSGLEGLYALTNNMSACPGGQTFHWDNVVFGNPADAGNAVADALAQVTCSFTVAPSPTPKPTPKPTPTPTPGRRARPRRRRPGDGKQRLHRPDVDRARRTGDEAGRHLPGPLQGRRRRRLPADAGAVREPARGGRRPGRQRDQLRVRGRRRQRGRRGSLDAGERRRDAGRAARGARGRQRGQRRSLGGRARRRRQRRRGADHRLPLRVQRRRRRDLAARRRPGLGRDIDHGRRPRRTAPPTPAAPRPRTPRASARRRPPRAPSSPAPTRSSATRPSAGSCSAS